MIIILKMMTKTGRFFYPLIFFLLFTTISFSQKNYGITVFGTNLVAAAEIKNKYGTNLDELVKLHEEDKSKYETLRKNLNDQFIKLGLFAYADGYLFESYTGELEFIIDFVEKKDEKDRLNFRQIVYEELDDINNLIKEWNEYEELSFQLFKKGEISDYGCPVIHCLWAFNHPKLEPYLQRFNGEVPKHEKELERILNHSASAEYRSAASFLLAHASLEHQQLLDILLPGINDPNKIVRNNSMRVIYYIVRKYPDSKIDIGKVITGLNYPSFTDRNKALVILRSLPLDRLTEQEKKRVVPILMEIMEKKDAHNYRNAHLVLKKISKMEYGEDDINSWKQWAATVMNE